ncbi:MAG: hypothetical protein QNJ47_18435 [Nostocaceae cyanobacterium]|nr:hypothetical protein [Nostocaceae cyanobacterium]
MLKKIVASLLTSVGLFSFNPNTALAERAVVYDLHKTFYPSTCSVFIGGEEYTCNYMVIGGFNDASGNIKLCSNSYCLIMMLNRSQLVSVANGRDFYVRKMSWQRGYSIDYEWNTSMKCGFRGNKMGCLGELANGNSIGIYID